MSSGRECGNARACLRRNSGPTEPCRASTAKTNERRRTRNGRRVELSKNSGRSSEKKQKRRLGQRGGNPGHPSCDGAKQKEEGDVR